MSEKNVAKLRKQTGLPIAHVIVRGGTEHRRDLYLEDGSIARLWRDGEITHDATHRWERSARALIAQAAATHEFDEREFVALGELVA